MLKFLGLGSAAVGAFLFAAGMESQGQYFMLYAIACGVFRIIETLGGGK